MQNIYVARDGKKMEFKWKVNANVARCFILLIEIKKKRLSETFFSHLVLPSRSYSKFCFIAELLRH